MLRFDNPGRRFDLRRMNHDQYVSQAIRVLRYGLSGAIIGAATSGLIPFEDSLAKDVAGAAVGFGLVIAIKLAHII